MHWHYDMAKDLRSRKRVAARTWLVDKIRERNLNFLLGDLSMSAYVLCEELRACGIECNLLAWHCEMDAKCENVSYDSCVIIAVGGPRFVLKPNTPETHMKMGAQCPFLGPQIGGRGCPLSSFLPTTET